MSSTKLVDACLRGMSGGGKAGSGRRVAWLGVGLGLGLGVRLGGLKLRVGLGSGLGLELELEWQQSRLGVLVDDATHELLDGAHGGAAWLRSGVTSGRARAGLATS